MSQLYVCTIFLHYLLLKLSVHCCHMGGTLSVLVFQLTVFLDLSSLKKKHINLNNFRNNLVDI